MLELLESELKGEFIFFVLELFGPYTQWCVQRGEFIGKIVGCLKGQPSYSPGTDH